MTIGAGDAALGAAPGSRKNTLILASASPRRQALLAQIGVIPSAILPADIDETPKRDELPRPYARRMAAEKCAFIADAGLASRKPAGLSAVECPSSAAGGQSNDRARQAGGQIAASAVNAEFAAVSEDSASSAVEVAENPSEPFILAADTVVSLGRRILGKPRDAAEAARFLLLLSGRRHRVTTAICLRQGARLASRIVETRVKVKRLSDHEISAYLRSEEWRGKAGGYAIQGLFGAFIPEIHGSYTNVVGLPLTETAALLTGMGFPVPYEVLT